VSESPAAHSLHLNLDTIVQSAAQLQSAGFCVEKDIRDQSYKGSGCNKHQRRRGDDEDKRRRI
jgi:hypothetical protein